MNRAFLLASAMREITKAAIDIRQGEVALWIKAPPQIAAPRAMAL